MRKTIQLKRTKEPGFKETIARCFSGSLSIPAKYIVCSARLLTSSIPVPMYLTIIEGQLVAKVTVKDDFLIKGIEFLFGDNTTEKLFFDERQCPKWGESDFEFIVDFG